LLPTHLTFIRHQHHSRLDWWHFAAEPTLAFLLVLIPPFYLFPHPLAFNNLTLSLFSLFFFLFAI